MHTPVSIEKCTTYEYDKLVEGIKRSFEHLGGIESYIKPGERVLLKLNLLLRKKPEAAVTTHPQFAKALGAVLMDYGARVIFGDSPGGPFNSGMLKLVYNGCGITAIAEELGAELNFNTEQREYKNSKGRVLKQLTLASMIEDADKIISVSKLKTHSLTTITGAVKNMFGIVPGVLKAEYHFKMQHLDTFSDALVDICLAGNPVLSFMDGIIGMEGAGPSGGDPREVGVILASPSPYHLDVAAATIMGIDPLTVPTIKRAAERGLCGGGMDEITVKGEKIENFIQENFQIPSVKPINMLGKGYPPWLLNLINSLLQPKPVFNHEQCIGCGVCARDCPAKVISMVEGRPRVELSGCIRCFCCQELCPEKAVTIHRPLLMRLASKL